MRIERSILLGRRIACWLPLAIVLTASSESSGQATSNQPDQLRFKLQYLSSMMHNRQSVARSLAPPRFTDGKETGGQLSWRVHLLPFIGEPELFEEFHFDEPWDSPHNKSLLPRIPAVYADGNTEFKTRFQVFCGPNLLFGRRQPVNVSDMVDGPKNTILMVVTSPEKAVLWTQPDDLAFDAEDPAKALGNVSTFECVMGDGKLASLPTSISAADFAALITPAGREVADVARFQIEKRTATSPGAVKSRQRREIMERLKSVGMAMMDYHDTFKKYPVDDQPRFYDQGRPKLSWRVHLLPFLDQKPLFDQFKLDEPWDSPHNKQLLRKMPTVYASPAEKPGSTTTRFVVVRGAGALFSGDSPPNQRMITDGSQNTALVIRVGTNKAVPWTKPDDAEFDPQQPKAHFGKLEDFIYVLTADGAVRELNSSIPEELVRALMTHQGKETVDDDELRKLMEQ